MSKRVGLVKRASAAVVEAVVNWLTPATPGFRTETVLEATLATNTPAGKITNQVGDLLATEKSAGRIIEVTFTLTHQRPVRSGGTSEDAGGQWSDDARIEGNPDVSEAGSAHLDEALAIASGTLRGLFDAQPSRPASLIIDQVWLEWYTRGNGALAGTSTLKRGFRINSSPAPGLDSDLPGATVNVHDNFSSAYTQRIDDGSGFFLTGQLGAAGLEPVTWENIALIQVYFAGTVVANTGAGNSRYFANGARLTVFAHETWTP
jgi:hypothetical protein